MKEFLELYDEQMTKGIHAHIFRYKSQLLPWVHHINFVKVSSHWRKPERR